MSVHKIAERLGHMAVHKVGHVAIEGAQEAPVTATVGVGVGVVAVTVATGGLALFPIVGGAMAGYLAGGLLGKVTKK
jgi:hypothetical protein